MENKNISEITPEIYELTERIYQTGTIDPELYTKYEVKRGLRDISGKGVLAGLTRISDIQSFIEKDGERIPCEGKLFYRGINIKEIVRGFMQEKRHGFEEVVYLLLMGNLPDKKQLSDFTKLLAHYRTLPTSFVRDIIMKAPSPDMMNTLARSVLTLYSYDDKANDISIPNVLRQSLQLIALFPLLSVYGYQAYRHYHDGQSLFIHVPDPELSTAENILHLLRPDSKYTELEAKILDVSLVLQMCIRDRCLSAIRKCFGSASIAVTSRNPKRLRRSARFASIRRHISSSRKTIIDFRQQENGKQAFPVFSFLK